MLRELIEKKQGSITTLIAIYVVLKDYINEKGNGENQEGLTSAEVGSQFRNLANEFSLKERYYPSYLQRHSGGSGFFEEADGRYIMRGALVNDESDEELNSLVDLIIAFLNQRNAVYEEFFQELNELVGEGDISRSKDYILSLFGEDRFENFGQIFEVLSYSVLKVYFESFGFQLKRFSVSFSNDGGIDFISANGIYQVTASADANKVSGDLEKLPGTSRVMVLSTCTDAIRSRCYESEVVTEVITSEDLKNHFLEWMYLKDKKNPRFMGNILSTIREEMERETN